MFMDIPKTNFELNIGDPPKGFWVPTSLQLQYNIKYLLIISCYAVYMSLV